METGCESDKILSVNVNEFQNEVLKILIEAFNGGEGEIDDGAVVLNLEENTTDVIENENENVIETDVLIEACPRCKFGWLEKECVVCHGAGMVGTKVCHKCNGTGKYVLRPTQYYEGKKCYSCNGTGRKITYHTRRT